MSRYTASSHRISLRFYYQNHGIDTVLTGNQVWIRGSETDAWIPVFTLPVDSLAIGGYHASPVIDITNTLADAVPAQNFSSSFQIKLGEQGFKSVNALLPTDSTSFDNGVSYDDITLTLTNPQIPPVNSDSSNVIVLVYPNPAATGFVHIYTSVNCNRIELRDIFGRLVKVMNMQGVQHSLYLQGIARGVYFISVWTDGGKRVKKLVVE
jgi:hypothetical protein